jgi:predicted metal-dependent hydrolase
MKQIAFGRIKIKYQIKRGKRKKTIGLVVQPNTSVIVLSPEFLLENRIKEVVLKRAGWILKQQERIGKLKAEPSKDFVSGESFPYLGRQYRLKIVRSEDNENAPCKLVGGRFYIEMNKSLEGRRASRFVQGRLLEWYRARAQEKIEARTQEYVKLIGQHPEKIFIKNHEKRWGSCSSTGILRFNWKVIMAPLSILDYVIVHELCHLSIKNHSDKFWNKLGSFIPDYKKKRQWLKENSFLLTELLS